jgi:hypothetical protein
MESYMLPDYSNDAAYDAMWGGGYETPESIEAERIEEAKNGLVDFLAAQIAAYNQIHRLEVDDKALKHAVECISDVVGDMYAGYAPNYLSSALPTEKQVVEALNPFTEEAKNKLVDSLVDAFLPRKTVSTESLIAKQNQEAAKSRGEHFEQALNTITFSQIASEAHNG